MTTPAGWYDDGSGRQRWWDGEQWTEHVAPVVETPATEAPTPASPAPETPASESPATDAPATAAPADAEHSAADGTPGIGESAASIETGDSLHSVAAVEGGGTWSDSSTSSPAEGDHGGSPAPSAEEIPPYATPSGGDASGYPGAAPTAPDAAPGYPDSAPTYPGAAPSYPGSAPVDPHGAPGYPGGAPMYPGAGPSYPGSAPTYPAAGYGAQGGYPGSSAPTGPARLSVVGLVGLGLAGLGTILSCIPFTVGFGWILLGAGFIVSLISLFLKGRKWPGISGLILSFVGAIIAVVMAIFFVGAALSEAIRDLPTPPPASDSDTESTPPPSAEPDEDSSTAQVEEGSIGDTVTLRWLGGTGEVTVTGAAWSTDDGSGVPSTNGGYLTVETTWTGIDGVTPANPLFTALETADGTEGQLDFFVTGAPNELLESGQTVSGPIAFDIAQSDSYVLVITDEAAREIARISIVPTAG
ncbi:DUF2510 domain-containing protein [Microbacterium sp. UFMG61]|uniref:DUF2510 domain-containing protein n=1 Tax=Microbacterium sp. UFMG61 TaxID=2745935 RepID=UPI001E54130F|nr:DUF2510 domain-containing protein [Microbacterium sp. UFMG61]